MFFFVLLLVLPIAVTPRSTENCFRFASSFAFAPCVQCATGFYLDSAACLPCTDFVSLPRDKQLQCQDDFYYGSNIGPMPTLYQLFSSVSKTFVPEPPKRPDESPDSEAKIDESEDQVEAKAPQKFNLVAACLKYVPANIQTNSFALVCIECKPNYHLDSSKHICLEGSEPKNGSQLSPGCINFSTDSKTCLKCEQNSILKDGRCEAPPATQSNHSILASNSTNQTNKSLEGNPQSSPPAANQNTYSSGPGNNTTQNQENGYKIIAWDSKIPAEGFLHSQQPDDVILLTLGQEMANHISGVLIDLSGMTESSNLPPLLASSHCLVEGKDRQCQKCQDDYLIGEDGKCRQEEDAK